MRRLPAPDLILIACVAIWGLNVTISKYALGHGFSPLSWAAPRFTIATLLFVVIARTRQGSLALDRGDMRRLALWGGVVLSSNQIGFTWSLHFASAATVSLLFGMMPILAGIFSQLLGVERMGTRRWLAAGVSFTGVALVAIGATTGLHTSVGGIFLALYGPASFALYSIMLAPLVRRHGTLRVNALASLFCLPVLLTASVPELVRTDWGSITTLAWLALAFSAIVAYAPTNLLWFHAVSQVGTTRAAMYINLQPFFGAISAMLMLSEEIHALQWVGGVMIVGGIVLSRLPAWRSPAIEVEAAAPHE